MLQKDLALVFVAAVTVATVGCGSSDNPSGAPPSPLENTGGTAFTAGATGAGGSGATTPLGNGGTTPVETGGYPQQSNGGATSFPSAGGTTFGNGGLPSFGNGGLPTTGNGGLPTFGNGGTSTATGGTTGAGGTTQMGSTGGTTGTANGMPVLPAMYSKCPTLTNGGVAQFPRASGQNVPVTIYIDPSAKSKPAPGGPLIIYWHATLSNPAEVLSGFTQQNISAVTAAGGVVAAPATTACSGCTTTDDGYWFVEDDVVLDEIVSCAVQQANIDVTHIHTLGWSAGALHTTHVAQARSNYIASFISYSGGLYLLPSTDQNPANKVAGILTYGDPGSDVVILDFNAQSQTWYKTFQPMGWYSMMCHHPGGHEVDPQIAPLSLRFFKDHPFEVNPEPYANMIPSGYPSYCSNMAH
ncbi:MAG TPA: hypothetical protein VHC69_00545 [Polyangiaceae bacterium]|nr:hypothetical protein [Polyangiaceae bacterium]